MILSVVHLRQNPSDSIRLLMLNHDVCRDCSSVLFYISVAIFRVIVIQREKGLALEVRAIVEYSQDAFSLRTSPNVRPI
jgi:hypothetical protein